MQNSLGIRFKCIAAPKIGLLTGLIASAVCFYAAVDTAAADRASNAASANPSCSDPNFTEQQFAYASARQQAHDYAAARAVLENLIRDCHADTRRQALDWLLQLPSAGRRSSPSPPPSLPSSAPPAPVVILEPAGCPDAAVWKERLTYVEHLRDIKDWTGARSLLESGLADCNASVRQSAAEQLLKISPPDSNKPAPPETTKCPDFVTWKERFAYAGALEKRNELEAERTILASGVGDCNPEVRAAAATRLVAMPKPPFPDPKCPGDGVWKARIDYANKLISENELAGARTVLTPALSDCDPTVRQTAYDAIAKTYEKRWYERAWDYLTGKFGDAGDTIGKAVAAIILILPILLITTAIAAVINRKRLRIDPLTVFGDGFDGKYFVAIATAIAAEMEEMGNVSPSGVPSSRSAPLAEDAGLANLGSAAEALAGDSAGKLLGIVFAMLDRPRYRSSGTVRIAAGQAEVAVQVTRGRRVIGNWTRSPPEADLIDDLKDIAYLVLLTTSRAINAPRS